MTTNEWAAEAFRKMVWQMTFMPDGEEKKKIAQFLIDAPESVKREAAKKEIPGL